MSSTQVARWGKDLRHLHAALAVSRELEGAADVNTLLQAAVDPGDRGSMILGQCRFGVEGVHLTGSPPHEEKDAGLGLGGEVGLLGSQRVLGRFGGLKPTIPAEQRRERQASHASAESVQEIPATHLSQARVGSFHPRTNLELTLGHDHSHYSIWLALPNSANRQGSLQEDELVHIDENQAKARQQVAVGVLLLVPAILPDRFRNRWPAALPWGETPDRPHAVSERTGTRCAPELKESSERPVGRRAPPGVRDRRPPPAGCGPP